jgi:CheY-like chemotaxis protein
LDNGIAARPRSSVGTLPSSGTLFLDLSDGALNPRRRKIVLVVEDDHDSQVELIELLSGEGYTVLATSNGQEALDVLGQIRPHLILLDLMMPILSGWEVLAAMSAEPMLKDIPVVVLSAYAAQAPVGVACTLRKPICIESVLAALCRHCE